MVGARAAVPARGAGQWVGVLTSQEVSARGVPRTALKDHMWLEPPGRAATLQPVWLGAGLAGRKPCAAYDVRLRRRAARVSHGSPVRLRNYFDLHAISFFSRSCPAWWARYRSISIARPIVGGGVSLVSFGCGVCEGEERPRW